MSVHLAKGTRDLLPRELTKRLQVVDTLRHVFKTYGFEPLETPAFERIETLTGKYGDEGDQLLFRILKRGEGALRGEVDLGLRYDLTVPLARVIAMNPGLRMPFKRYQIEKVWRAERPQKGRFREFCQCDVDTIGCTDPIADAECVAVVHDAMQALEIPAFTIRVNHRALLTAIVGAIGAADRETPVLVAIDKLDKIGRKGVSAELSRIGLEATSIDRLWSLLEVPGLEALDHLSDELGDAVAAPVENLRAVVRNALDLGVDPAHLQLDLSLARGLSYYTGPIFETVTDLGVGSVSGGGRYDELIGMFSGKPIPAVGVSLGLDRLVLVLENLGRFEDRPSSTEVFVTVFSEETTAASRSAARAFRAAGIPTQIWMGAPTAKLKRQLKQAGTLGARHAVVIGPDEAAAGHVMFRNLDDWSQEALPLDEAVKRVRRG